MKILCVGGGPSSAYFSILMKKNVPNVEITIIEKNLASHRSGWGVIIPDSLFVLLEKTDSQSYDYVAQNAEKWNRIRVIRNGEEFSMVDSGSRAISRHGFTNFLLARAEALGTRVIRPMVVDGIEGFDQYDLVVWGDGAHSFGRSNILMEHESSAHLSKNRFIWLGTRKAFDCMSFIFRATPHGPIWVHAYPFEEGLSTFIVECTPSVFEGLGFSQFSIEKGVSVIAEIFDKELQGEELLSLKAGGHWRQFLQVQTSRLSKRNHVLVGDAAHTAHFSIGSGTRMAIEDAWELSRSLIGQGDLSESLDHYSNQRVMRALEIQKPALNSMRWFDKIEDFFELDMPGFVRALMFRSAYMLTNAPTEPHIENLPA